MRAALLFGVGLMSWSAAGCNARQLPGSVDETVVFAEAECRTCTDDRCGDRLLNCARDEACKLYARCRAQCGVDDHLCRTSCMDAHPGIRSNGFAKNLERCWRDADDCLVECTGLGGMFAYSGEADCGLCADKVCADAVLACLGDDRDDPMGCESRWACAMSGKASPQRTMDCYGGLEDPDGALARMKDCKLSECETQCRFGEDWSCVGDYAWSTPSVVDKIPYEVMVVDFVSGPLTIASVGSTRFVPCQREDCHDCWSLATVAPAVFPPSGGQEMTVATTLDLGDRGFDGCIALENETEGKTPTLHYWSRPIVSDDGRNSRIGIAASQETWKAAAGIDDVIAEYGHLMVRMYDCRGDRGSGVRFEILDPATLQPATNEDSRERYMNGNFWRPEALEGDAAKTNHWGRGGWYNVPPGRRLVRAVVQETGEVVASHEVEILPGTVTELYLWPDPATSE